MLGDIVTPVQFVVQTRGLTRSFGALTAVDHIDLQVATGSIFGLLGPNGAARPPSSAC